MFVMNALVILKNIITDTGYQKLVYLNVTKFQKVFFVSSNKNLQKKCSTLSKVNVTDNNFYNFPSPSLPVSFP